ncbi:MAG: hypothetical protein ACPGUC_05725 [Gammaproteobacteria bacterium]
MNILFVFMLPRACGNIEGSIPELIQRGHSVSVFCHYKMAEPSHWPDTSPDPSPLLKRRMRDAGAELLSETPGSGLELARQFDHALGNRRFDLALFDTNKGKRHWGNPLLYRQLRKRGVPVIGCQEGSLDDGEAGLKPVSEGLGLYYDYCFCLGGFDKDLLLRRNPRLEGRVHAVGLPSNDRLSRFDANADRPEAKHVMLVPSWTPKAGATQRFDPMTDDLINRCGAFEMARRFKLPLLIKEKTRPEFAFKFLEGEGVQVSMDETHLDEMIAESACVIGAPSTLLFKSIQLGIPTAVLSKPRMGQLGVFAEFDGTTESDADSVMATLEAQAKRGRASDEFIERALAGGSHFESRTRFADAVEHIGEHPSAYRGRPLYTMGWRKALEIRFPHGFLRLHAVINRLRNRSKRTKPWY